VPSANNDFQKHEHAGKRLGIPKETSIFEMNAEKVQAGTTPTAMMQSVQAGKVSASFRTGS